MFWIKTMLLVSYLNNVLSIMRQHQFQIFLCLFFLLLSFILLLFIFIFKFYGFASYRIFGLNIAPKDGID